MTVVDEMLAAARAAMAHAYAPYSKFHVGAALRTDRGNIYAGCNVENSAYPEGSCAETAAIAAMVVAGERRIVEVLVIGGGPELITPCGGCRQRLREFAADDVPIHLCNVDGPQRRETLGALLPRSFGPEHL